MQTEHLTTLHRMLVAERARLVKAQYDSEIAIRKVWVSQLEKEIAAEMEFLGMDGQVTVSDAELDEFMKDFE